MEIEFLGAARTVTGSCYLIRNGRQRLLVDCGMTQGDARDEAQNREPFPFDPTQIDAVILTHAHLDHSGRLPLLVRSGFKGPIYTHRATRDLCRIMLRVAAAVHTIGGFSAHADQSGLLNWYGRFRTRPPVALVHGEPKAMETLQTALHGRYQARVSIPAAATVLDLRDLRL